MLPTITVLLSISLFMAGSICFIYLGFSYIGYVIISEYNILVSATYR